MNHNNNNNNNHKPHHTECPSTIAKKKIQQDFEKVR